jgi:tetratricopeptide (TPR) repeat protein
MTARGRPVFDRVRVLATSRQVLHVQGEVRLTVEPLAVPDLDSTDGSGFPAVELFNARARAARPRFELTEDAAALVAEISRLVDGLPLAIELAAARVNVLGLAELLSLVRRRLELLRDQPASDAGRAALATLVEGSYDLLHADEKMLLHQLAVHRGGASLRSLIAAGRSHGLDEATVTHLLGALVDKSIVTVSFPSTDADARYDLLDTVRDYALEHLAEGGGLAAAQGAHAEYFAALADSTRPELRGRDWQTWVRRLELEHDNLWAALTYARDAPTLPSRSDWGRSAGTSRSRSASPRDGASSSSRSLRRRRTPQSGYGSSWSRSSATSRPKSSTSPKRLRWANTRSRSPRLIRHDRSWLSSRRRFALAVAESGDGERAAALAEQAYAGLQAAGDDWRIAVGSLLRAQVAALRGDVSTVAAMAAEASHHADVIGFDAFQVPALLLEAWVERRKDDDAAADAYQRAFELAGRAGFADHASFALAGLGSHALVSGDLRDAEELERRALAAADAARSPWASAHARVQLARVLAAAGDAHTAETLYRHVLEWSDKPRSHGARESLFVALAGDPATAALAGLAELTEAREETTSAPARDGRPITRCPDRSRASRQSQGRRSR